MKLSKVDRPEVGDIVSDERILYFISGRVIDGLIRVRLDDRDWFYDPKDGETRAYFVTDETANRYTTCIVTLDKDNKILYNSGRTVYVKKSEMECMRTPGMVQEVTKPCMGMYTFNKGDDVLMMDGMKTVLIEEINLLNDQVASNRSAVEMS